MVEHGTVEVANPDGIKHVFFNAYPRFVNSNTLWVCRDDTEDSLHIGTPESCIVLEEFDTSVWRLITDRLNASTKPEPKPKTEPFRVVCSDGREFDFVASGCRVSQDGMLQVVLENESLATFAVGKWDRAYRRKFTIEIKQE